MQPDLKLLSLLYKMYVNNELAAEFDKKTNKMSNSAKLDNIMSEVKQLLPEELTGLQAAKAMKELKPEIRDSAIDASKSKVIDMRKEFLKRMSENGGALGLTKQLVTAIEAGDTEATMNITINMIELVNYSDSGE